MLLDVLDVYWCTSCALILQHISMDPQDDPWCRWMSIDALVVPWCTNTFKWMPTMTLNATGCLWCQLKLKLCHDVLDCSLMNLNASWCTWLQLDVLGCCLMYLDATWCTCLNLSRNFGSWCTWIVFDANLLVCQEKKIVLTSIMLNVWI